MEPESVINSLLAAVAHLDRFGGYVPPDRYGCSLSGGIDHPEYVFIKNVSQFLSRCWPSIGYNL
jgi:hypothetical protein